MPSVHPRSIESMASRGLRGEGTLTKWNDARGFGFITPTDGGRTLFVHVNEFPSGSPRPHMGEQLTFEVETTRQGKQQALVVQRVGLDVPPSRKPSRWAKQNAVSYVAILAFCTLYLVVDLYWRVPAWVAALYVVASILCIAVYAADKRAAVIGRWRISESSLLALGLLGGWPGSIVAQQLLRHKTRKRNFQIAFWGCVALNVIAFVVFNGLSR